MLYDHNAGTKSRESTEYLTEALWNPENKRPTLCFKDRRWFINGYGDYILRSGTPMNWNTQY